jgi:hypothetical protein
MLTDPDSNFGGRSIFSIRFQSTPEIAVQTEALLSLARGGKIEAFERESRSGQNEAIKSFAQEILTTS